VAFVQPTPDGPEGEPMVALFELGARRAADAVRNGEQAAEALVEALLARCAASPLNAFITLEADRLRAAARAADQRRQRGERLGPLHGGPLALKDNIDTADFPTTGGTPALAAHRPKRNAPIVQHLLDAGAIVLGKTNLQELAYGPTNNNAAFGPARNPYDPTRRRCCSAPRAGRPGHGYRRGPPPPPPPSPEHQAAPDPLPPVSPP